MSNSSKADVAQAEAIQTSPRKRSCVNHCKRFWWAHLIALVCIIVLVVCLIIFVGVPHIAQSKVNSAILTVQGLSATNTQANNFTLSINSTIQIPSPTKATVEAFSGQMYLEDEPSHAPFVTIDFPQTTGDGFQTVNISQFVNVTDLAAITRFNTWLLWNDSVRVTVTGDTKVHVPGISRGFGVTFTKTVTMPGLRSLQGTEVVNSTVSLIPDANGNNFNGTVIVPNYSNFTFDLGNATFNTYLLGQYAGTSQVNNMFLVANSNNSFPLTASINPAQVLAALAKQPYCSNGGVLPFQLSGKTVTNSGQNLTYYSNALSANNQSLSIDIGGDLKREMNFVVPCL